MAKIASIWVQVEVFDDETGDSEVRDAVQTADCRDLTVGQAELLQHKLVDYGNDAVNDSDVQEEGDSED